MKKFKGTIITLVVFIILLGYYFMSQGHQNSDADLQKLISGVKYENINSVEIIGPEEKIKLEKEDDSWLVIGNKAYRGDNNIIQDMLNRLCDTHIANTISQENLNLKDFGLDPPKYKIIINTDEVTQKLYIGDENPVKDSYFVKIPNEDTIYKIFKYNLDKFTNSLDEFRDKTIFTINKDEIKQVEIIRNEETLCRLINNGKWTAEDESLNLDQEKVEEFIQDIVDIKVSEFIDGEGRELSYYGLDKPSVTVILEAKNGEKERLDMEKNDGVGVIHAVKKDSNEIITIRYKPIQFLNNFSIEDLIEEM